MFQWFSIKDNFLKKLWTCYAGSFLTWLQNSVTDFSFSISWNFWVSVISINIACRWMERSSLVTFSRFNSDVIHRFSVSLPNTKNGKYDSKSEWNFFRWLVITSLCLLYGYQIFRENLKHFKISICYPIDPKKIFSCETVKLCLP